MVRREPDPGHLQRRSQSPELRFPSPIGVEFAGLAREFNAGWWLRGHDIVEVRRAGEVDAPGGELRTTNNVLAVGCRELPGEHASGLVERQELRHDALEHA